MISATETTLENGKPVPVGSGHLVLLPDPRHQSQLPPSENKFHVGNGEDGKHYWLTPPDLYAKLNAEFGPFDFDPCPYPKPEGFDGLTCEWGQRNYVNPPFGSIMHNGKKKGPTAWMRKAIEEQRKGKLSVVVYPVDKWVLMMLAATGSQNVRNLGDVRWCATEDGSQGKGTGRHIACFVLLPQNTTMNESTRRKNDALKDCLGFLLQVRGQMEGANAVDNMMYRMVGRLVDDVLQALPQALRPTLRDRATILREGRLVTEGAATEMDAALDRIRWLLDGNKELERQVAERDKRIAILEKTVEGLRSSKPLKVVAFPRNHKRIIAP